MIKFIPLFDEGHTIQNPTEVSEAELNNRD
jgi:hypothetical protein